MPASAKYVALLNPSSAKDQVCCAKISVAMSSLRSDLVRNSDRLAVRDREQVSVDEGLGASLYDVPLPLHLAPDITPGILAHASCFAGASWSRSSWPSAGTFFDFAIGE